MDSLNISLILCCNYEMASYADIIYFVQYIKAMFGPLVNTHLFI